MARFFHLDRRGALSPGDQLTLTRIKDDGTPQAAELARMYPYGVSRFGLACLWRGTKMSEVVRLRELSLEGIRLEYYPHRPSRFASFFACRTAEEAIALRAEMTCEDKSIWLVECNAFVTLDMTFMNYMPRYLPAAIPKSWQEKFHRYWSGESSENPKWECLLTQPVTVLGVTPTLEPPAARQSSSQTGAGHFL